MKSVLYFPPGDQNQPTQDTVKDKLKVRTAKHSLSLKADNMIFGFWSRGPFWRQTVAISTFPKEKT